MNKKLILLINIIGILIAIFAVEKIIYLNQEKEYQKMFSTTNQLPPSYSTTPMYGYNIDCYTAEDDEMAGRKPDGLEYNAPPITVFGCSYAHGQYLNYKQTFSYKLAHILKRPVYNRAIPAKGLSQMYYQSGHPQFYKDVPKSNLVFYIMLDDHYRRMKSTYLRVMEVFMYRTYEKVGDKLKLKDLSNPIKCFLTTTYIGKTIANKWVDYYIHNPKNAEILTDEALMHYVETRKNLEKNWNTKDIDFVVIFYDPWLSHGDLLKEKLEKNNFKVIRMQEITDEDIFEEKYFSPVTVHPAEAAWDLITPRVVEILKLNK